VLVENTTCGADTTCLGACSEEDAPSTCATPLGACSEVDARCGAICATRAAVGADCSPAGTFHAYTDWPIQDEALEERILAVLPQLNALDEVRRRANLVRDELRNLDVDDIVENAEKVGNKEAACASVVSPTIVETAAALPELHALAESVLESVLAFEAATPVRCIPLLASTDECQQCIGRNCCPEYDACVADPRCGSGPTGGEAFCVVGCVLGRSTSEEVTDAVKQECAAECAALSGASTLSPASIAVLECIDMNVGGGCQEACYAASLE
jgi:hypothetical protein